ncbi:MAG: universal stress protein [Owenweeksia sp.]|nr:universal stress protein [Owenweeksia sp.]
MKILLPTDFSENAELATKFALDLAKKTDGHILAFHAYDVPQYERSMTTSLLEEMREAAEKNMRDFESSFLKNSSVSYSSKILIGNPIRLSKELIEKNNREVVIMGTKGASGMEEFLIGSNAASVIHNVDVPVMVIPPKTKPGDFKSMVLASDLEFKNRQEPLQKLAKFARVYQAKVSILHIQDEDGVPHGTRDMVAGALGDIPHSYHISGESDDVEGSILDFCEKQKADLVVAISKRYGFFQRLFHKSLTSKLAYHSKIPMLALHEPH